MSTNIMVTGTASPGICAPVGVTRGSAKPSPPHNLQKSPQMSGLKKASALAVETVAPAVPNIEAMMRASAQRRLSSLVTVFPLSIGCRR
jgi:hypothetical protein